MTALQLAGLGVGAWVALAVVLGALWALAFQVAEHGRRRRARQRSNLREYGHR